MVIIRTALFYITLVIATTVLGLLAIITIGITRKSKIAHSYGKLWSWLILTASGVKLHVSGLENLNPSKTYIFAANHASQFDIFALYLSIPIEFRWLAKIELFSIPILGHAMKAIGYIPIDRTNRKAAFESIDYAAEEVKNGKSIIIFPEGTRSEDGILQEFKKGGFILAIKSQQPIVPISINGSHRILRKHDWKIYPGTITVKFGKPIPTQGMTVKDRHKLIELLRQEILRNLSEDQKPSITNYDSNENSTEQ
ncbi:MAG TPA: 1-acyl-sn-glycerol-3-phosphate acyltransferase [Deltaproteobacteria bacterium]|nr:MAG: 1-acyl-sn-glycerol-3-phosphate acyltransferase [Deltaproteobacteria bacterium]RLB09234.1 MAG: 1-acyl-sn-glycerol-3-phosphate acyltransferase [Deltaproteobacteria bacterium]HDM74896.1 1-acyl-sn-glycerol-3-phosphate acyltransferase [Deltaproteobacteria bacterium]HEC31843.1 1-acyl-sn-glycerol-3-phosphate acyltransferase [Deltaproteobacteria bacterium]